MRAGRQPAGVQPGIVKLLGEFGKPGGERVGVIDHVTGADPAAVPLLASVFDHRLEMVLDPMPVPRDRAECPGSAGPQDLVMRPRR